MLYDNKYELLHQVLQLLEEEKIELAKEKINESIEEGLYNILSHLIYGVFRWELIPDERNNDLSFEILHYQNLIKTLKELLIKEQDIGSKWSKCYKLAILWIKEDLEIDPGEEFGDDELEIIRVLITKDNILNKEYRYS